MRWRTNADPMNPAPPVTKVLIREPFRGLQILRLMREADFHRTQMDSLTRSAAEALHLYPMLSHQLLLTATPTRVPDRSSEFRFHAQARNGWKLCTSP